MDLLGWNKLVNTYTTLAIVLITFLCLKFKCMDSALIPKL